MTLPATKAQRAEAIHAWEERAGIIEAGGFLRADAEEMATTQLGYRPHWGGCIVRLIDAGRQQEEAT